MKIAINNSYGYFSLSEIAEEKLKKMGFDPIWIFDDENTNCRADPRLIKVIEELGEKANGEGANIKIVEIPDNIEWILQDDDRGHEWIAEKHKIWK